MTALLGEGDVHLAMLEEQLEVECSARGNQISISGEEPAVTAAEKALKRYYDKLEGGQEMSDGEFDAAIRHYGGSSSARLKDGDALSIKTPRKTITPATEGQAAFVKAMRKHTISFGAGPAGTGKTYLAVAMAVEMLERGEIDSILLSRPAVEAGESLGFLPGDLKEKIDPYLRPLYDALHEMLGKEKAEGLISRGIIEIAPLAYMRGRTLKRAFIILDEAQNTTAVQMKMFLTRMGEGARLAITGDLSQTDIPSNKISGLRDAMKKLEGIKGISITRFSSQDVVRHPLAVKIIEAYEKQEKFSRWNRGDELV